MERDGGSNVPKQSVQKCQDMVKLIDRVNKSNEVMKRKLNQVINNELKMDEEEIESLLNQA